MTATGFGASSRDTVLERAVALPLGNRAALARVCELCVAPVADASGVALEAGRDEGFAALLLRMANTAYWAGTSRVSDLRTAVVRLGLGQVRSLALAAPGLRLLDGPADGLSRARQELHRHAIRTGLAARTLADGNVNPEEALAAGLLHNVGLNALSLASPHAFRLVVQALAAGQPIAEVEEERLGFSHAELGALLAERWSYPLPLVYAIRDHDADYPATELALLIRKCDLLVRETGCGIEPPDPQALSSLGIDVDAALSRISPFLESQDRLDVRDAAVG